ncbi:hypothetical protein PMAYCL1PPCAC_23351, partial [Pristionchus mayeri]
ILFLVLYVAWILFFWFRRWFKTDDDVITRHHIIHMKKLEEQQAAFEKMQKSCPKTVGSLTQRVSVSGDARVGQRAGAACTFAPFKLCLEGWICDSSSISVTDGRLECGDGWAILVMEGNSLILDTKSECKNKRWFINEKPFPKQVEATCGSIVRRN